MAPKLNGVVAHDKGTTPTMSRDHVTKKNVIFPLSHGLMDPKLSRVVT